MKQHNNTIDQLGKQRFITDGGLETTLIFENGIDLPEFAAFPLLYSKEGEDILVEYYLKYIQLARKNGFGFILEAPTWRASKSWGDKLGYSAADLDLANRSAIELLSRLQNDYSDPDHPMVISGCIGPRGDGYHIDHKMSIAEAEEYHLDQIKTFSNAGADLISAYTINYTEEAIGIVKAAQHCATPVVISFTVETDGRLPSGQPLGSAIREVDQSTDNGPIYYMLNCAHPSHFMNAIHTDAEWMSRIHAFRANASCKSHAELDEAQDLDRGNPEELASDYLSLCSVLSNLTVFGGCCGTDHQHIEAICNSIAG